MSVSRQMAEFISRTSYQDIPAEIIDKAKQCLLDSIGVAIYGSTFEPSQISLDVVKEAGGKEESTILGTNCKAPSFLAAMTNGIRAHVADYDDVGGLSHPSCVLMPTTLNLAEAKGLDGRSLLTAFVLGNEIGGKQGEVMMWRHYEVGFHSTGTVGTIAAAAAAAKLLGLSPAQTTNALGIAASSASGIRQNFGTMTKCWHAGHAASAGILAALSAQKGYDASPQALDGKIGFIAAFQGNTEKAFPTDKLGNPYFLTKIMFRKYPGCHGTHAAVDVALKLRSQYGFSPQEIEAVECYGRPLMSSVLIYKEPATGLQAKFSLEYCVAAALTLGCLGIAQFTDEAVLNPEVRKTMQKLSVIDDEDIEKLAKDKNLLAPARVKVILNDGQEFSQMIEEARGGPSDPLSWPEIEDKFLECTSLALPVYQAREVISLIHNLEEVENISALTRLLSIK